MKDFFFFSFVFVLYCIENINIFIKRGNEVIIKVITSKKGLFGISVRSNKKVLFCIIIFYVLFFFNENKIRKILQTKSLIKSLEPVWISSFLKRKISRNASNSF